MDVIGEILRDGSLTPEQRHALVQVYRSFRAEAGNPVDHPEGAAGECPDGDLR